MSSLVDLFNGMQKTASRRQPDAYDRAAAANGMTTEQYLDKVAEAHVAQEYTLVKSAQVSYDLGQYMARGYWDTLSKVANSHPVRDGVPEIYINIAQASKFGLAKNLIKAAAGEQILQEAATNPGMFKKILESITGAGRGAWEATGGKGIRSVQEALAKQREIGGIRDMQKMTGDIPVTDEALINVLSGSRNDALTQAALRLGLPAAGIGAAGTGAAYGLGAFD